MISPRNTGEPVTMTSNPSSSTPSITSRIASVPLDNSSRLALPVMSTPPTAVCWSGKVGSNDARMPRSSSAGGTTSAPSTANPELSKIRKSTQSWLARSCSPASPRRVSVVVTSAWRAARPSGSGSRSSAPRSALVPTSSMTSASEYWTAVSGATTVYTSGIARSSDSIRSSSARFSPANRSEMSLPSCASNSRIAASPPKSSW